MKLDANKINGHSDFMLPALKCIKSISFHVAEKITSLWVRKLALYDSEESALRAKLGADASKQIAACDSDLKTEDSLAKWRQVLFGQPSGPQVDFQGNMEHFVAVR